MSKRYLMVAFALLSTTSLGANLGCGSDSTPSDQADDDGAGTGGAGGSSGSKTAKGGGGGGAGRGGATASSSSGGNAGGGKAGQGGSSGGGGKGTGGASGSQDGGPKCSASAQGMQLIDDMTATDGKQVKFAATFSPSGCADKGSWFDYNSGDGHIEPSATSFGFTVLPSDPGSDPQTQTDAGAPQSDASSVDASAADVSVPSHDGGAHDAQAADAPSEAQAASEGGSATGLRGACIKGVTGSTQYSTSGMGLNFATVSGSGNGGDDLPAIVDASMFTGFQFQAWGGLSAPQSVTFSVPDKAETPGYGICDPTNTAQAACGGSFSKVTVNPGWQSVKVAFKDIKPNAYYGGKNETALDPATITQVQWQIQQANATTSGVEFNFCVYKVEFYK